MNIKTNEGTRGVARTHKSLTGDTDTTLTNKETWVKDNANT